jgi:hypothetical protein
MPHATAFRAELVARHVTRRAPNAGGAGGQRDLESSDCSGNRGAHHALGLLGSAPSHRSWLDFAAPRSRGCGGGML